MQTSVCLKLFCTQVTKSQNLSNLQNQSWHKFIWNKTYTHKHQTQNLHKKKPSPFHTAPVKKKHKSLGLTGIIDQAIDLSTPDFKTGLKREREKKKKKRDRGNKKN